MQLTMRFPTSTRRAPRRGLGLLAGALMLTACGVALGAPSTDTPAAVPPAAGPASASAPVATASESPVTVQTISYGDHEDTVFDVHRPSTSPSGTTVVLVHGGFWREQYRRDLMDPLVPSLLAEGHVVVNLEYRRIGGAGAWPALLTDVAAGIDALADVDGVDSAKVVTVGHSAGGHLAVWLAGRHQIPAGQVGADPAIRPCHAVSQAGVLVFDEARAVGLGNGAVDDLLGEATEARLAAADPARLLPLGVPVTLVHGQGDDIVPLSQSESWVALATAAGDDATLIARDGDHFSVISAAHPLWLDVVQAVTAAC